MRPAVLERRWSINDTLHVQIGVTIEVHAKASLTCHQPHQSVSNLSEAIASGLHGSRGVPLMLFWMLRICCSGCCAYIVLDVAHMLSWMLRICCPGCCAYVVLDVAHMLFLMISICCS